MKCQKCSKNIPDVSTTCPFCDHPVGVYVKEKDKITIPDEDDESLTYVKTNGRSNRDNDIKIDAYIDEPKKKNYKMGVIAIVVLVIVIVFLGVFIATNMTSSDSEDDYHPLFAIAIKEFFDHFIENYTGNYAISSGEYKINAEINYDKYSMSGTYGFDTKNRILALTGQFYIDYSEDIVVDYNEINYTFYLKRNEAHFESSEILDKAILFPITDNTGYLASKSYDLEAILNGMKEALIKSFNKMELKTTEDNINHLGISRDVNKTTIILNNEVRRVFYKTLYKTLLDDSNFINEYARVKNVSSDEMTEKLEGLLNDVDYKYLVDEEETDKTAISIYHYKGKVYRFEIIGNTKESNYDIELDVSNNYYHLDYYKDGKNIFTSSLEVSTKETENTIRKLFKITFDDDDAQRTFDIEILKDKTPSLKKYSFNNEVNVRDLTDDDYKTIENNVKKFMADISWIRVFGASFNNICSPELSCNCPTNSKICSCTYNGSLISCNKEDVIKVEENNNNDNEEKDKEDSSDKEDSDDDDIVIG